MTKDLQSSDLQLLMSRSVTCKLKIVWNLLQNYMEYCIFSKYPTSSISFNQNMDDIQIVGTKTYLLYKHWKDSSNKGSIYSISLGNNFSRMADWPINLT